MCLPTAQQHTPEHLSQRKESGVHTGSSSGCVANSPEMDHTTEYHSAIKQELGGSGVAQRKAVCLASQMPWVPIPSAQEDRLPIDTAE